MRRLREEYGVFFIDDEFDAFLTNMAREKTYARPREPPTAHLRRPTHRRRPTRGAADPPQPRHGHPLRRLPDPSSAPPEPRTPTDARRRLRSDQTLRFMRCRSSHRPTCLRPHITRRPTHLRRPTRAIADRPQPHARPRWGDELTIRAAADAFGCTVHVLTSDAENWHLRYTPAGMARQPSLASAELADGSGAGRRLFLTYISPVHYNCIRRTTAPLLAVAPPPAF